MIWLNVKTSFISRILCFLVEQLFYSRPNIYEKLVSETMSSANPFVKRVLNGEYAKTLPYNRTTSLKSIGGTDFTSFSKSSKFGKGTITHSAYILYNNVSTVWSWQSNNI